MNIPLIIANIAHALDKSLTPQEYSDLQNILQEEKKEETFHVCTEKPCLVEDKEIAETIKNGANVHYAIPDWKKDKEDYEVWFDRQIERAKTTSEKETKRKIRNWIKSKIDMSTESYEAMALNDVKNSPELKD